MIKVDPEFLKNKLSELLLIPSPTGYTDSIVRYTCGELEKLGVEYEITRRGAVRANLPGTSNSPDRALVAHLDTIGAMVSELKPNGRLAIQPLGTWNARFAEGARVTIFTDTTSKRGSILPLKASGHAYNDEVDTQEVSWKNLEIRTDERVASKEGLLELGFNVGDYVAVDCGLEQIETGFAVARHIDGKGGVAILLAVCKAVKEQKLKLPIDCHFLFTITEEVGSGASAGLHQDVAELVTLDMAPISPNQNTDEYGANIILKDESGPFDYHLSHHLIKLCQENRIRHQREVLRNYFCDSTSAVEAGCEIRTALVGYGVDASHGYERSHLSSLESVAEVVLAYIQSDRISERDKKKFGPIQGFTKQPD